MGNLITFLKLIKLLWDRRDQLLTMLENLPTALHAAGEDIETSGQKVITASYYVKGGGGVSINARQQVNLAATVIEQCGQLIDNAGDAIKLAASVINQVKVPTVTPTYTTIEIGPARWRVVNGLNFGERRLFGSVADALQDTGRKLKSVNTNMQNAASNLHNLGEAFNDAGNGLHATGKYLEKSGRRLKEVTEDH